MILRIIWFNLRIERPSVLEHGTCFYSSVTSVLGLVEGLQAGIKLAASRRAEECEGFQA
jgi:hypothetical protein